MGEQEVGADEETRLACGAEPRDLSEYSSWRDDTDLCVLEALDMYGTYLIGQTNGLSDALALSSVVAVFDIEGVASDERPELTRRLLLIHSYVTEIAHKRQRKAARG